MLRCEMSMKKSLAALFLLIMVHANAATDASIETTVVGAPATDSNGGAWCWPLRIINATTTVTFGRRLGSLAAWLNRSGRCQVAGKYTNG